MTARGGETDLLYAFLLRIPYVIPDLRLFRRQVGLFKTRHGDRVVSVGVKGQCDLHGYLRGGRGIEIETKAARGVLSDDQKAWRDFCAGWGVPYVVLRQLPDETPAATVERWCAEVQAALLPR